MCLSRSIFTCNTYGLYIYNYIYILVYHTAVDKHLEYWNITTSWNARKNIEYIKKKKHVRTQHNFLEYHILSVCPSPYMITSHDACILERVIYCWACYEQLTILLIDPPPPLLHRPWPNRTSSARKSKNRPSSYKILGYLMTLLLWRLLFPFTFESFPWKNASCTCSSW